MNLDLYSDRAKQAVQSAQSLALARRHQQFAPEHQLKVLLEERDGLARNLITAAGGDPAKAETATETALKKRAQVTGAWLEVHHAPAEHAALVGKRVRLRWENTPALNAALWGATFNVPASKTVLILFFIGASYCQMNLLLY